MILASCSGSSEASTEATDCACDSVCVCDSVCTCDTIVVDTIEIEDSVL